MMIIEIKDYDNQIAFNNLQVFLDKKAIEYQILKHKQKIYFCLSGYYQVDDFFLSDQYLLKDEAASYYFVSKKYQDQTIITDYNLTIGGHDLIIIGGPCSVESSQQMERICSYLHKSATNCLRGGIFKPRTSPYAFQGLKGKGLQIIKEVATKYHYPIVCELTSLAQVEKYAKDIDIIQIGARNMQNYELLKAVAQTQKPIILKRGFTATINELLCAAEYIFVAGNPKIILCERGIRTFEDAYRNVTDINAIVLLKQLTHLPVIIDPSHATGSANLVERVALSAITAGCDGLLVETHYDPENALSDGAQSLDEQQYLSLITKANDLKKYLISKGM